jgi:tetratricopeptide (TPR) repeat protein
MKLNIIILLFLLFGNALAVSAQKKALTTADSIKEVKRQAWIAKQDSIKHAKQKKVVAPKPIVKNIDSLKAAQRQAWIAKQDSIKLAKQKKVVAPKPIVKNIDSLKAAQRQARIAKQDSIKLAKQKKVVAPKSIVKNTDSLKAVQRQAWIAKQDSIKLAKQKKVVAPKPILKNTDSLKSAQRQAWIAKQDSIKLAKQKKSVAPKPIAKNTDSLKSAQRQAWIAKQDSIKLAKQKKPVIPKPLVKNTDSLKAAQRQAWIAKQDSIKLAMQKKVVVPKPIVKNMDSLKAAQRQAWIAKQDSIKQAKQKKALLPKSLVKNTDSLKAAQRQAWIAKQDSIKAAKQTVKSGKIIKSKIKKQGTFIDSNSNKKDVLPISDIVAKKDKNIQNIDSIKIIAENKINNDPYIPNFGVDDIIIAFSNNQFDKVIKTSAAYLQKYPTDTNIILKTGLSYIFDKQYAKGFDIIDKLIVNKDSIVQYYSTLPFINNNAKKEKVYNKIIEHIQNIDANNLWTLFAKSNYYKFNDSLDKAKQYAQQLHYAISNKNQAAYFGYLYPMFLNQEDNATQAIAELEKINALYPNVYQIELNLFILLKETNQWDKAFAVISNLYDKQNKDIDLFNEKLDLSIKLKKYNLACEMINENNIDFAYDYKIFSAKCQDAFIDFPLKHNSNLCYKINQKGDSFKAFITIDASTDAGIIINYQNDGKANNKGNYTISNNLFDSCRVINTKFFNQSLTKDSAQALICWISKTCFAEIEKEGATYLDIGTGLHLFELVNTEMGEDENVFADRIIYNTTQKKLVQSYHLINWDNMEQVWILKNKNNPLIVKIDGLNAMELYTIEIQ